MDSRFRGEQARATWRVSPALALGLVIFVPLVCTATRPAFGQEASPGTHDRPKAGPLSLEDAVDRALAASPSLRAASAGIDAARGSERQAGLLPNPELSFEAEDFKGSGQYREFDSAQYAYSVSQEIQLGGKRSARRSIARAEREAAEFGSQATRLELIQAVTIAYFEAAAADRSLALAEELEGIAKRVLNNVNERVKAAREPDIQLAKAEVALATASSARQRAENARDAARQALARYWGDITLSDQISTADLYTLPMPEALDIYQARLSYSPDIVRFTRLRDAREADHRLARAEAVPDPKLSVGFRQYRDTRDDALVAGISIPFPVFNRNQGDIARARAEVVKADSERQQAELDQARALSQAWSQWRSASVDAASLRERILPQGEKAFRLALTAYDTGRFSYLEVLDAQRTLFEARTEQIDALKRLHISRAEVERLAPASRNPAAK